MSRRPTEEDLGIETTPEEQEILSRPVQQADDDIRQDEDADESLVQAAPKPEAETAEAKAVRERDESGKFVAKTSEPKPEPSPDERKVDLRALQEARAENKVLMERMTALLEAQQHREARAAQPVAEAPPPVPKFDDDPIAAGRWIQEQIQNINEDRSKTAAQQEAEHRERQEIGQAYAIAQPQFQQASATDPTMAPTYSALMVSFAREIAFNNGIPFETATPQQQNFIRAEVAKLETDHVKYAVGTRQNVADYVRGLAQARGISIQPQQLAAATPPGEQHQPQGKTIAERQQAQARHMSIGDLPGSAVPTTVSAKTIAKMSSAEFAAFAKKMGDAGLDEMFSKI
jgi:hypothetical protein